MAVTPPSACVSCFHLHNHLHFRLNITDKRQGSYYIFVRFNKSSVKLILLSSYACIEKWKIGWSLKMMNYNSYVVRLCKRKTAFSISADDLLNYFLVRINFKDYFYISFSSTVVCRVDISFSHPTNPLHIVWFCTRDGNKIYMSSRFSQQSFLYTILRLLVTIGFSTGNIDPPELNTMIWCYGIRTKVRPFATWVWGWWVHHIHPRMECYCCVMVLVMLNMLRLVHRSLV